MANTFVYISYFIATKLQSKIKLPALIIDGKKKNDSLFLLIGIFCIFAFTFIPVKLGFLGLSGNYNTIGITLGAIIIIATARKIFSTKIRFLIFIAILIWMVTFSSHDKRGKQFF